MKKITSPAQVFAEIAKDIAPYKVSCYPNPAVGCAIVYKQQIISKGYHLAAGMPHAEVEAINAVYELFGEQAQQILRESEIYVTLEPCAHHGRTPPCAERIVQEQIPVCYIEQADITDKVNGKGVEIMRNAGIAVHNYPVPQLALLNHDFFALDRICQSTVCYPYVRVKVASSIDGISALPNGHSKWITNGTSRSIVQALRSHSDAIVTSGKTVVVDQARYNIRAEQLPQVILDHVQPQNIKNPTVFILDNSNLLDTQQPIFTTQARKVIVSKQPHALQQAIAQDSSSPFAQAYAQGLVEFWDGVDSHSVAGLRQFFLELKTKYSCNDVLVETGSMLTRAVLDANVFDELHHCIGPVVLGAGCKAIDLSQEFTEVDQACHLELAYRLDLDGDLHSVYVNTHKISLS